MSLFQPIFNNNALSATGSSQAVTFDGDISQYNTLEIKNISGVTVYVKTAKSATAATTSSYAVPSGAIIPINKADDTNVSFIGAGIGNSVFFSVGGGE